MNRLAYTKIFLNSAGVSSNETNVRHYSTEWWYNVRSKSTGGLRLTTTGRDFLKNDLEIQFFKIEFPPETNIQKTNVLLYLDKFITCPYYLTPKYIQVTDDRKAMEISLFSGDLEKYGLIKAIERQKNI
jgi:hypothetical protein